MIRYVEREKALYMKGLTDKYFLLKPENLGETLPICFCLFLTKRAGIGRGDGIGFTTARKIRNNIYLYVCLLRTYLHDVMNVVPPNARQQQTVLLHATRPGQHLPQLLRAAVLRHLQAVALRAATIESHQDHLKEDRNSRNKPGGYFRHLNRYHVNTCPLLCTLDKKGALQRTHANVEGGDANDDTF